MRCKSHPEVWALGDCACIPTPEPYPNLAQHALREAEQAYDDRCGGRDDQGSGDAGGQAAEQLHRREAQHAGHHRRERSIRELLEHEPELAEDAARETGSGGSAIRNC